MDIKAERIYLNVLALVLALTITAILIGRVFSDALLNWMFFVSLAALLFLSVRINVLTHEIHAKEGKKQAA